MCPALGAVARAGTAKEKKEILKVDPLQPDPARMSREQVKTKKKAKKRTMVALTSIVGSMPCRVQGCTTGLHFNTAGWANKHMRGAHLLEHTDPRLYTASSSLNRSRTDEANKLKKRTGTTTYTTTTSSSSSSSSKSSSSSTTGSAVATISFSSIDGEGSSGQATSYA